MINEFNALLTLNLQYFAEGGEQEAPETNPDGQPPAETKVESPESAEKTFTQAQLDELIAKRIERERKKFADYDELKSKLSEFESKAEEKRQSELTDLQKVQEQAQQFEAKVQELTAQLEAERTKSQDQTLKAMYKQVASSFGIVDVEAALILSDLSAVSFDENGEVIGVEDAIKKLVEHKPYLVAKKHTQPIGTATNGGSSGQSEKTAEQLLAEAAEKAQKTNRPEDFARYAQLKRELR